MSAISTILARLRAAIWAIDVRDDIANAIEQCYSDVSNPTLKTEALEAALQNKIDQGKMAALTIGDGTITGAKLANGTIPKAKLDPSITFDADAALDTTSTNAIQNKVVASELATVKADLDALSDEVHSGSGMTDDIKQALFDCISHIGAWTTGEASDYIDALERALFPSANIYTLTANDLELKQNARTPPDYSDLNSTRLSYTKFDLRLSGGKTYRIKATSSVNTANMGVQFYNDKVLTAVNAGQSWANYSGGLYDPGWQPLDVTLDVPAQLDGYDIVGVRITFRKNASNEAISDVFISKITIEEVAE